MIVVRDVERSDLPKVGDLLVVTWHATYDAILGPARVTEITESWHSVANLGRQLGVPETAFLLAEDRGDIVAAAYATAAENGSIMLRQLYVLPSAQGRGTGRALLDETVARFPGAPRVRLEVEPKNVSAIRFYERNGFRPIATAASCGGRSDLAALIMEKALTPSAWRSREG